MRRTSPCRHTSAPTPDPATPSSWQWRRELKRALEGLEPGAPELAVWERRLEEVEEQEDPI